MDSVFIVWCVVSVGVFFAGLFIYRRALRLQTNFGFEQVVSTMNELSAPELSKPADELAKLTALYSDSLARIDQLMQDSDVKTRELQECLSAAEQRHRESAMKDGEIGLLKIEQDKLRVQLAEEKKYCEQTVEDCRTQFRNVDQKLNQSKSDYEITLHEKELAANRLMKEKEEWAARCDECSRKTAELEMKLQESAQAIQVLKNDSAEQLSVDDEETKKALQKSIALLKELKADNDALSQSSKTLKQNLEQLEAANRNLEDKEQQLQYELVKSRAQLLGLEQLNEEFKKKIEQLMTLEKR